EAPAARASLPGAARPAPAAAPTEMRVSQLPIPPGGTAPPPASASSSGSVSATASGAGSLRAPLARMKETPPLPPDPPASGLAPDQLAFWKEVIERTKAIDKQNYF